VLRQYPGEASQGMAQPLRLGQPCRQRVAIKRRLPGFSIRRYSG